MKAKSIEQQIATDLGLSKGRVSQLKREGMPTTSVAAARAWRASRLSTSRKLKPDKLAQLARSHLNAHRPPEVDQEGEVDGDDFEAAVRRLRQAELNAYGMLEEAVKKAEASQKNEDFDPIAGLRRNHILAATNRLEIERKWERHRRTSGDVAPVHYLVEVLRNRLEPLDAQLVNFPRVIAAQANPQDPATAERAIEAGLAAIRRQISTACGTPVRPPEGQAEAANTAS